MSFLLLLNAKEYIGNNTGNKQLLHDFHSMKKKKRKINTLLESMGTRNLLVMNILQNIFFYVEVNKEIHTVNDDSIFIFG